MIAIIDYNAGNLTSVQRAVNYLGFQAEITTDPDLIQSAEKIIFPGVGAAKATMTTLRERGLDLILRQAFEVGKPMLGICIGIQILFHHSTEEDTNCLGILPGQVRQFEARTGFKVPQIGWNMVYQTRPHWIFEGVPNPAHFYFVNSYYPIPDDDAIQIGTSHYTVGFCSVVAIRNLVATQFHLEKSGGVGLRMLTNFLKFTLYPDQG